MALTLVIPRSHSRPNRSTNLQLPVVLKAQTNLYKPLNLLHKIDGRSNVPHVRFHSKKQCNSFQTRCNLDFVQRTSSVFNCKTETGPDLSYFEWSGQSRAKWVLGFQDSPGWSQEQGFPYVGTARYIPMLCNRLWPELQYLHSTGHFTLIFFLKAQYWVFLAFENFQKPKTEHYNKTKEWPNRGAHLYDAVHTRHCSNGTLYR